MKATLFYYAEELGMFINTKLEFNEHYTIQRWYDEFNFPIGKKEYLNCDNSRPIILIFHANGKE